MHISWISCLANYSFLKPLFRTETPHFSFGCLFLTSTTCSELFLILSLAIVSIGLPYYGSYWFHCVLIKFFCLFQWSLKVIQLNLLYHISIMSVDYPLTTLFIHCLVHFTINKKRFNKLMVSPYSENEICPVPISCWCF